MKPLKPTAETVTWAVCPAVSKIGRLDPIREKSAGLVVVVIDCNCEPEVAVTVMLIGPGVAEAFAWIATVCVAVLGVRVNVAGVAATPAGRPERAILTELENPFAGTIEIEMV